MNSKKHQGIPIHNLANFKDYHLKYNLSLPLRYTEQLNTAEQAHLSVFSRSEHPCRNQLAASRLDFYKISLVTVGTGFFTYGGQEFEIKPNTLLFINPHDVKTWQATSEEQDGYYCLFNEQFFASTVAQVHELKQYPYFIPGAPIAAPVLSLSQGQMDIVLPLFLKLYREFNGYASGRQEVLRLTLQLLMAETRRFMPPQFEQASPANAAFQLTQRFLDLLEKQFPIESKYERLVTKAPGQFADALAVHPNHLNACVKSLTGKTVREHLKNRITSEAQALLKYTDWQVSEIAYTLGFEEPVSFIHFFKKEVGLSPLSYRD